MYIFVHWYAVIFVGTLDTESKHTMHSRSQIKLEYDYYLSCNFSTFFSKCSCIELSLINNNYYYHYIMNFWTDPHTHKLPDYGLSIPNVCHVLLLIVLYINWRYDSLWFSVLRQSSNILFISYVNCFNSFQSI